MSALPQELVGQQQIDPQPIESHVVGLETGKGVIHLYFEKYQQSAQWRWRLRSSNHEIVASGESYWNESGCDHAINLVKSTTAATPVYRR